MSPEVSPTRIVADADVLAADLLVGGNARDALDIIRSHSWLTLVASDALLDDAQNVIESLADSRLATDWREHIEPLRTPADHPPGDHPGLASAYRGGAAHLITFDEGLTSAQAGAGINRRAQLSIRTPHAFAHFFDPESLYPTVEEGDYPGPDRDSRY